MTPTSEAYNELQEAYEHFNKHLFENALPPCLITLQRQTRTYGYFSPDRFIKRSSKTMIDEIAMNPAYFATRPLKEVLSVLVHEMAHLWQQHFGKPGRGRYHNKQWGDKMEAIGLHPSNTGRPGGKRTGDQMDHYIVDKGPFDLACDKLTTKEFTLSWLDRFSEMPAHADNDTLSGAESQGVNIKAPGTRTQDGKAVYGFRLKYSHICSDDKAVNVWGKPDLKLNCGECGKRFEPVRVK